MYTRNISLPKSSFFLLGVRGTGKSTWLKQNFKERTPFVKLTAPLDKNKEIKNGKTEALWFNLLDEELFQRLLVSPGYLADSFRALHKGSWVVIDEIQRLPRLLNEVHRGIEDFNLKFALTGSSARKLKREGVNLLGGRATLKTMYPLMPNELGNDYNLDKILRYGSLPLIWTSEDPIQALRNYGIFYLKQEIQAEALVRDLAGFARCLPVLALFNGQEINISSLARDAGVERKTAEGYLTILEDTLMAKRLYPYQAKITVREKKRPKLYWVDSGVVRAAKMQFGPVTQEEKGALFESYVFSILSHEVDNNKKFESIHYWSPAEAKTEVDFLLETSKGFVAIEVKSAKRIKPEYFKGLLGIKPLKGLHKRILVVPEIEELPHVAHQKTKDGIDIFSLDGFVNFLENYS